MATNSQTVDLYNETRINLVGGYEYSAHVMDRVDPGSDYSAHVIVGADPVSFKTMVRIYGRRSSPYISFLGKDFWSFVSYLRDILGESTNPDEAASQRLGITIEDLGEGDAFRLKGEYAEVTLCRNASYELAYEKELDILHITRSYLHVYRRIKPGLGKLQTAVYQTHSPDTFRRVREYFEAKDPEKYRHLDEMVEYFGFINFYKPKHLRQ